MPNYLIQPASDHTADPDDVSNAVLAMDIADPGAVSGLANGTAYVAREFVLSPASAAFTPALPGLTQNFVEDFAGGFLLDLSSDADWTILAGGSEGRFSRLATPNRARYEGQAVSADTTIGYASGTAWTNQKALIRVSNVGGNLRPDWGVAVRASDGGSGLSGYRALYDKRAGDFLIQEMTNGTATLLATHTAAISANDTIALEVIGTALNLYINDVEVWSGTDATHSSGTVGIVGGAEQVGDTWELDLFEGWN